MADWSYQRYFEDVKEGDEIPPVAFPLPFQRMVMEAGANRDFSPLHNNRAYATSRGAPDVFANVTFCTAMWERAVREWIGLGGTIRKIGPFRIGTFNPGGETIVVSGKVVKAAREGADNIVELEIKSSIVRTGAVTVGPAPVVVTLPSRQGARASRS